MQGFITSLEIIRATGRTRGAISMARYRYHWVSPFRSVFIADAGDPGRTPQDYIRAAIRANEAGRPRELLWD